jgi:hypothetical protein
MTSQPCTLPAEDLIAYADGYLSGGRRELVEAHLVACPHCRERLAAFRDVDRLLQEGTPLSDDPEGRAEIRTRLERADRPRRPVSRLLAAPVLVALLALVLFAGPGAVTEAAFPLGRFITFGNLGFSSSDEESTAVAHVAPSDPSVLTLPFRTVEPAALPFDLVLAERSTPDPDRLELLYRNGDDLALLVIQSPAEPGMITIDAPSTETHLVQGSTVLMVMDPRPDAVALFVWERQNVFFEVAVLEAPTGAYGGLEKSDALEIVAALIVAQDAA